MIESFDAVSQNLLFQSILTLALLAAFGIAGEILIFSFLRLSRRRDWLPGEVFFNAITWQTLFWCLALGFYRTLPDLLPPRFAGVTTLMVPIAGTLAFIILIVRLVTGWITFYLRRQGIASVSLINNTIRFLGVLTVIATMLALLGVPLGPLLTVVAGSSVGLTLALRDPLANFFSGMVVVASNKIRPGDYIKLDTGEEGYVTDIRWSDTYIRQLANNLIVIPNSRMTNTVVTNFNRPDPQLAVLFDVGVSYDADLAQVETIINEVGTEVMQEVAGGVEEFEPFVRYNRFTEWGINLTVILRGQTFGDQFTIKHEFVKRLRNRFAQAGLEFPRPLHMVELSNYQQRPDGNGADRQGITLPLERSE
ncbi:MAG: mechanosensitive ion channel family protein [Oscillochloris sp.]|nr:mechanosensitive ion channel family protein [Oscillochloris sp.]